MKHLVFISLVIVFSSCATLFSDGFDTVSVKSEPSGALVLLNGEEKGQTPLTFKVKRDTFKESNIRLEKKGYKPKTELLKKTLNSASIFNLLSLSSWATDALSGHMIVYSPDNYFITLESKGKTAMAAKIAPFVVASHSMLLNNFLQGEGEYLNALSEMKKIPTEKILELVKPELKNLIMITDSVEFYRKLELCFS